MNKHYAYLKEHARALADYIALEPLEKEEIESLRNELLRIDALLRKLKAKEKILFETQKYHSRLN